MVNYEKWFTPTTLYDKLVSNKVFLRQSDIEYIFKRVENGNANQKVVNFQIAYGKAERIYGRICEVKKATPTYSGKWDKIEKRKYLSGAIREIFEQELRVSNN